MLLFWLFGFARTDSTGKFEEGRLNHMMGMDDKKTPRDNAESLLSSKSASKLGGEDGSKPSLSYNVFSMPTDEGEKGSEKGKTKKKGKKQKRQGKNKKGKGKGPDELVMTPIPRDLDQENMMMAAQSTYQPPVSSLLLKSADDKDKKKDYSELERNMEELSVMTNKAMKGMEDALSHMSKAMNLVSMSKEIASTMAHKDGSKRRETPKSQNLLNYNVIEVEENERK